MTWVDAVLAGVVALSAIIAFFRGLVREVLSLAAWAGAAIVALALKAHVRPYLSEWIGEPWIADAAAGGIIFLIALILFKILTNAVADRVQDSALGGLDRVLGLAFGAVRGALLLVLAYILAGMLVPETETWPDAARRSRLLPLVAETTRQAVAQAPEAYRPRLVAPPGSAGPTMDDLLRPPARSRD